MQVGELWRYPVKSLRGERLAEASIGVDGVEGDRLVHVEDGRRRVITSRTHPRLLRLQGGLDPAGEPTVDGLPWRHGLARGKVRHAAGPEARLVDYAGLDGRRFDVLPLSVATSGAIEAMGVDGRRFRPNVVVDGVDGLAERSWPGRRVSLGPVVLRVVKLRGRCVMTTYDPDTIEQDLDVLRRIVWEFDGVLALDCAVETPGVVRVGDAVRLLAEAE